MHLQSLSVPSRIEYVSDNLLDIQDCSSCACASHIPQETSSVCQWLVSFYIIRACSEGPGKAYLLCRARKRPK